MDVGRRFIEAFNAGHLDEAEDLLAPGLTVIAHGSPAIDRDAFIAVMRSLTQVFDGAHFRIEEEVDAGDTVVQALSFGGKHVGEYLGIAASNREVSAHQIWILHTDGTRITAIREEWDALGLLRQMQDEA